MPTTTYPQFCALARATEIVGERWTLLIVRDLLRGPRRFSDLVETLHGITPAVLTARLNQMLDAELIEKQSGLSGRSTSYNLTTIGMGLRPAIDALILWGGHFLFPMREGDMFNPAWAVLALEPVARRTAVPNLHVRLILTHDGKESTLIIKSGGDGTKLLVEGEVGAEETGRFDCEFITSFDVVLQFLGGFLPLKQALASGVVQIKGPQKIAALLPSLFNFDHLRRQDSQ